MLGQIVIMRYVPQFLIHNILVLQKNEIFAMLVLYSGRVQSEISYKTKLQ